MIKEINLLLPEVMKQLEGLKKYKLIEQVVKVPELAWETVKAERIEWVDVKRERVE